jgi:hypothetical protein
MKKTKMVVRSSVTGQWVKKSEAKRNPRETETERVPVRKPSK